MDMSSLQSGLPRPAIDPTNVAFKEAALSLTNLYKASQQSRHEGYIDAIDEIYTRFLDGSSPDINKMKTWIDDRRRKTDAIPLQNDANTTTGAIGPEDYQDSFETEPIVSSPVVESTRRVRIASSPTRRHGRTEVDRETERERRDRNGAKRRVIGALDSVSDFHKRGRFG